ncbi:hypothetical protein E1264_28545 [Actinomadura sp. KC216]|uniref:DUF6907 domain-containing protein n=1 Tax=Actinomadura sp. KC216 TaxID=2530370 RepID=UPI001053D424|nr:hypothetical protein [Actinomadura sp. KC216]TDB83430.1 hypothetical protein E1264_28545 [Actinomadura sp. KC216]
MSAATKTATAKTCPAWCAGDHADSADYRHHQGRGITPTFGLYASISWSEPLTATARAMDAGPKVFFKVGDGSLSLTAQQATDLAEVMEELERDDAAGLLRDMVARIERAS